MLYETFASVRKLLKSIPEIKSVQWYNAQYDGTIYVSPIAFVEFPDRIPLDQVAGSVYRAKTALRIHIVSAIASGQDNSINDDVIQVHESIAQQALDTLNGKQVRMRENRTTSLIPSGWQHYHKYRGFLITFIDFTTSVILE